MRRAPAAFVLSLAACQVAGAPVGYVSRIAAQSQRQRLVPVNPAATPAMDTLANPLL